MQSEVTAFQIKEALAKKHCKEFFMTECKNGPSYVQKGQMLRFDAVAIYKSWSPVHLRGYEIKVSRSDFQRDAKYPLYLPYFNEFYFICPKGIIRKEECPPGCGLMWYNPETGNIVTKLRAVWNNVEPDPMMLMHIIMNRLDSDRLPFFSDREEYIREYLKMRDSRKLFGASFRSALIQENQALQKRIAELDRAKLLENSVKETMEVLKAEGVSCWSVSQMPQAVARAIRRTMPVDLEQIQYAAEGILKTLEKAKKKADGTQAVPREEPDGQEENRSG